MIRLDSADWRLWLDPTCGVQWLAADIRRRADEWHPVLPDCRPADSALDAASFHMLPYSNRIREGRFRFDDALVQLAHAERHAIHGALRKLPWSVVQEQPGSLTCRIDSREHHDVNWPWAIVATITVTLDGPVLTSEMSVTNVSDRDMPAGLGWHPYFSRTLAGADPELTLPVAGVYPDAAGDCLPDGAPVALPPELDFTQARAIDPDTRIDCCLAGFEGEARIAWPDAGVALEMHASEACRHVVLFNPDAPYFAVEPVSNANDAFNLADAGIGGVGRVRLAPGDTLSATMRLVLQRTVD